MALKYEGKWKCLKSLGLEENATEDEIKKTYKKLALECHPDKNPDDPAATKRFRELSQSYYDLTSKYSKRSQHYCLDCGLLHTDFDDEDEYRFESEDEEFWMHLFKRLFMDVFSESIFQRRFQSHKKKEEYVHTDEEKKEESDFDFIFSKYCYDDIQLTAEDLKKFHSYDDWLTARDPKKRHNHRERKAKKKDNLKTAKKNLKPKKRKQQPAEQYRREKEMKEITEKLEKKRQDKESSSSRIEMRCSSTKKKVADDFEVIQQQQKSAQEQEKALQLMLVKQEAQEKKQEKKNKKQKRKQMKNQHEQESVDQSSQNNVEGRHDLFGNNDWHQQLAVHNSQVEIKQKETKSRLLQQHLDIFHSLIAVQPKRHTEQQLKEERSRQKELLLKKNQDELELLRNEHADDFDEQVKQAGVKSQQFEMSTDFENLRREHLLKQQELERRRNNEEQENMLKFRSKHVEKILPVKWYDKPMASPVKFTSVSRTAPSNIWSERQKKQNEFDSLRPQSPSEEEEILKKVVELSQKTAREDEEKRSRLMSIWSVDEDTRINKKPTARQTLETSNGKQSIQSGWKTEKVKNYANKCEEWTNRQTKPFATTYITTTSVQPIRSEFGSLKPLCSNSTSNTKCPNEMKGENWHEDVDFMYPNHGCPVIGPVYPVIPAEVDSRMECTVNEIRQEVCKISTSGSQTGDWITVEGKTKKRQNNPKNSRTSNKNKKKVNSQVKEYCEITDLKTDSVPAKKHELNSLSRMDQNKFGNNKYTGVTSVEILSENPVQMHPINDSEINNSMPSVCKENNRYLRRARPTTTETQDTKQEIQPRNNSPAFESKDDNADDWSVENWGDEIEAIINSEVIVNVADKNYPRHSVVASGCISKEQKASMANTCTSNTNFSGSVSQNSRLAHVDNWEDKIETTINSELVVNVSDESISLSHPQFRVAPIISDVTTFEQKPYMANAPNRNRNFPISRSRQHSRVVSDHVTVKPEPYVEADSECGTCSYFGKIISKPPDSLPGNTGKVWNSHVSMDTNILQSVNRNSSTEPVPANTGEDWEQEFLVGINDELKNCTASVKQKDCPDSAIDLAKYIKNDETIKQPQLSNRLKTKNVLSDIGNIGIPGHSLPRLPSRVLKKNKENHSNTEACVINFANDIKMSSTENDRKRTTIPEKASNSVLGMPQLGLSPHLVQEYMQYLMMGLDDSMLQNIGGMPLLPPPVMLTSPVFAYSLMSQQQMQGRTQQMTTSKHLAEPSQTESSEEIQNSSIQRKFTQNQKTDQNQQTFSAQSGFPVQLSQHPNAEASSIPNTDNESKFSRCETMPPGTRPLMQQRQSQKTETLNPTLTTKEPELHTVTQTCKIRHRNKIRPDISEYSSHVEQPVSADQHDIWQQIRANSGETGEWVQLGIQPLDNGSKNPCLSCDESVSDRAVVGQRFVAKTWDKCKLPWNLAQKYMRNEFNEESGMFTMSEDWDQEISDDSGKRVTVVIPQKRSSDRSTEENINAHKQVSKSVEHNESSIPSVVSEQNLIDGLQSRMEKYKYLPPRLQRKRQQIQDVQSVLSQIHQGE